MGPQHWWPAESSEEMMLGAILVQKYELEKCRHGFTSVKRKTNFDPQKNFIVAIN